MTKVVMMADRKTKPPKTPSAIMPPNIKKKLNLNEVIFKFSIFSFQCIFT